MTRRQRRDEQPHPDCTHADWRNAWAIIDGDWAELPTLAIDTETTGPDPEEAIVVELGAYWCPKGFPSYLQPDAVRFGTLINPGVPIPEGASRVHGIKDEDVAAKPFLHEVADRFLARVEAAHVLVAYNHAYDFRVLERAMGDHWRAAVEGKIVLDPLTAIRSDRVGRFWRGKGRHKLDSVGQRFNLRRIGSGNHRASSDAALGLGVLYHLRGKLPKCGRCAQQWLELVNEQDRKRFEAWKAANPKPAEEAAQ